MSLRAKRSSETPAAPLRPGRRLESVFAASALFVLTDPVGITSWSLPPLDVRLGAVVALPFYAVSFCVLLRRLRQSWRTASADVYVWLPIFVAVASAAWSIWPERTVWSSANLVGTGLIGVHLASVYTLEEQASLVWKTLGIAAIASLLWSLTQPDAVHFEPWLAPAWKGIYGHKNLLGQLMALLAVVSVLALLPGARAVPARRWAAAATLGLAVYLIHRADSVAAMAVVVVVPAAVLTYVGLRTFSRHRRAFTFVAGLLGVAGLLALLQLRQLLSFLGRDVTLTGRVPIWEAVVDRIMERPLLGYGYQAFWMNPEGPYPELRERFGWEIWHAHNGFLDLMLDFGFLGTTAFLLSLVAASASSLRLLRHDRRVALWPLMLLGFLFLWSLVESDLLLAPKSYTALYVATVLALNGLSRQVS